MCLKRVILSLYQLNCGVCGPTPENPNFISSLHLVLCCVKVGGVGSHVCEESALLHVYDVVISGILSLCAWQAVPQ